MSARVKRHLPLLQWLSRAHPKTCKAVIQSADKDLLDTLCECSLNILKGNVPLTGSQKRQLSRHKQTLRLLVGGRRRSVKNKRRLLQKGGFLGTLLRAVTGVLGSLLFSK